MMGFLVKRFWDVVLIAALMALLGGAALMQAAMGTGGNAFGQGVSGAFTFVKNIATGFQDADKVSPDNLQKQQKAPTSPSEHAGPSKGAAGSTASGRVN